MREEEAIRREARHLIRVADRLDMVLLQGQVTDTVLLGNQKTQLRGNPAPQTVPAEPLKVAHEVDALLAKMPMTDRLWRLAGTIINNSSTVAIACNALTSMVVLLADHLTVDQRKRVARHMRCEADKVDASIH